MNPGQDPDQAAELGFYPEPSEVDLDQGYDLAYDLGAGLYSVRTALDIRLLDSPKRPNVEAADAGLLAEDEEGSEEGSSDEVVSGEDKLQFDVNCGDGVCLSAFPRRDQLASALIHFYLRMVLIDRLDTLAPLRKCYAALAGSRQGRGPATVGHRSPGHFHWASASEVGSCSPVLAFKLSRKLQGILKQTPSFTEAFASLEELLNSTVGLA